MNKLFKLLDRPLYFLLIILFMVSIINFILDGNFEVLSFILIMIIILLTAELIRLLFISKKRRLKNE